ncbi:MAG: DUF86 domain-containing protein [Limnothrix sp. RL_2_0]|nr:DUF86 domain-containing protein [Limnothrix sp. RL_2_0]
MRDDIERLRDIEEAIIKIEKYAVQGKAEFFENELIQTWIIFQLQVIGEAARSTSEATQQKYARIDWRNIIDFRNLLVHEYFRVDIKIVWKIIETEIPKLKRQIAKILT